MKTLAKLQAQCRELGLTVETSGRPNKEPWIARLRQHYWEVEHPDKELPPQIEPMLLGDWTDLDSSEAEQIEQEGSGWLVQPKLDGVRALLHVGPDSIRITSRTLSVVTYRLAELQENLPHLTEGLGRLTGTVLDGELVCPKAILDTGSTVTAHPLQAAMAILATSPAAASQMQHEQNTWLRFHVFDVLRCRDQDITPLPLLKRLDYLAEALNASDNPYVEAVPSFIIGKMAVHRRILESSGEGTVWKRLDSPYEPGRRVRHWLKRKAEVHLEAFVSAFKAGNPSNGHAHLVGAVEFSARQPDGSVQPVAWVSTWSDEERRAMTLHDAAGVIQLNPAYLGRKALIAGQDLAAKSRRLRHARLLRWLDS